MVILNIFERRYIDQDVCFDEQHQLDVLGYDFWLLLKLDDFERFDPSRALYHQLKVVD